MRTGLCVLVLGGCVSYTPKGITPGAALADVVAANGEPTSRYALPQGTRLEYARGPMGKHTFMIDLDASGHVVGSAQVLTEENFAKVLPGASRDSVLWQLGRPSEKGLTWQGVELWSYRYETFQCQWFVVSMERSGVVRDAGFTPDPMCNKTGEPVVMP